MANLVEREGEQIQASLEKKAEHILENHGFNFFVNPSAEGGLLHSCYS